MRGAHEQTRANERIAKDKHEEYANPFSEACLLRKAKRVKAKKKKKKKEKVSVEELCVLVFRL